MKQNKLPLVCAFRLMQEVYCPLKKFRDEMVKIGREDFSVSVNL